MPGVSKIQQAMRAIQFNEVAPKWLDIVGRSNVAIVAGRLHVMMLPVLRRRELVAREEVLIATSRVEYLSGCHL